jgi:hypothetical protein
MPWFELDEAHYDGSLPPDLSAIRERLRRGNADWWGIDTCPNLFEARRVLEFSNRKKVRNELIVVRSDTLQTVKGEVSIDDGLVDWLGFDVVVPGHGSILVYAFHHPELFHGWESRINEDGLLTNPYEIQAFAAAHSAASERGDVEVLPPDAPPAEPIELGRVR